ncbi:signal peptide peptidase SppA [Agitococcus lubricus]|uniref:Protease-4 n=1 Tax=Agitococcus lubricus TaxID=1077255 RepID=A0A2T5J1S2_9GAMM|nr:signal peptide peptidase SppA [Agitococcus lubricus]PTQ90386.1 protease-4 [Agitococcus lubricus]
MSDNGREWQILEKAVMASVDEQRKARRWGIVFKILTFIYILVIIIMVSSPSKHKGSAIDSSGTHLAVVEVNGEIADDSEANADDIIAGLNDAFTATNSKAVVLRINSPGGSPVQSAYVYDAIRQLRAEHPNKKLYAVITDLGASGAYYMASAADQIYVSPASLVGSIGVIMQGFGVQGLTQKIGIEDRTMTAGNHKAIMNPMAAVSPEEKAHVQKLLDTMHQQFITAVKQGRGQRLKENPDIFSGLFWTGQQAVELGLADGFGSVKTVNKLVGTDEQVNYTTKKNPMDDFIRKLGASMGETIAAKLELGNDLKVR